MKQVLSSGISGARPLLAKETFKILRGSCPLFLISGPCALESPDIAYKTAETVKKIGEKHNIVTVFKGSFEKANRQKPLAQEAPTPLTSIPTEKEIAQRETT